MKYLLGVDFGGGSSKATLLREDGKILATSSREYPTSYFNDGWAEQNPDDSYHALVFNIHAILKKSGVNPDDIVAMSLDGATHTSVLLDELDQPVRPSIYWTDRRSIEQTKRLTEKYNKKILDLSLNAPSTVWTLPHLLWVKENEPENFRRISKIMFMKDYVRYCLTGDFVTDSIEAMGSMLMDATNNRWSEELCEIAGISVDLLPEIVEPTTIISPLTSKAIKATGLGSKTKILAGTTDTVMEVFAAGAIKEGQATIKLATAGRICLITDKGIAHPYLVNYRHVVPGLWYPGTATKSCAASYRWYRDVFCGEETEQGKAKGIDAYTLMDEAAQKIPAGSNNLFYHPYLQGEITPYLDNDLRASFTGISSSHTKGHFNRAVMEGVAYSLKDCLEAMRTLGMNVESAAIIGGGSESKLWRQIVSDVLNIPLSKSISNDSSLGSAMLAGVATGVFDSYQDSLEKCIQEECEVFPNSENREVYEKGYKIYKEIHDAMAPVYKSMAKQ